MNFIYTVTINFCVVTVCCANYIRTNEIGAKWKYKIVNLGTLTFHFLSLLFSLAYSCLQNLPYFPKILNSFIHSVSPKNVYV